MMGNNIKTYIKEHFSLSDYFLFGTITFVIFFLWSVLFKPVLGGDSLSYIYHAEEVLGKRSGIDSGIRGPVYYYLLAGMMKVFGETIWLKTLECFQYLLLWLSGLFIYKIIMIATGKKVFSWFAGLFNALSLSSINYGSLVVTESLSIFLFVLLIFMIIRKNQQPVFKYMLTTGIVAAVLFLTRFNMISLLLWIIGFFLYSHLIIREITISNLLIKLAGFLIPAILFLFLWSFRNNNKFGFFSPFIPNCSLVSLNALYAIIDERTKTSLEYEDYKDIIIESRKSILSQSPPLSDGTLMTIPSMARISKLNYGFNIRVDAFEKFHNYFDERNIITCSWYDINRKLRDFHKDIIINNRMEIFKIRLYSFFAGFRPAIASLPLHTRRINEGKQPSFFLFAYKLLFIGFTALFFLNGLIYLIEYFISVPEKRNHLLFVIITLIFYLHFVNFIIATTNDAVRYKFPVEALTFGIVLYLSHNYFGRLFLKLHNFR